MDETTCVVCGETVEEGVPRFVAEDMDDPRKAHIGCGDELPEGVFYEEG